MTDQAAACSTAEPWAESANRWVAQRLPEALRRARRIGRPVLLSVTRPASGCDPVAVLAAARRGDEPTFFFEQPDRDGAALAGLGAVRVLHASGPDRHRRLSRAWRDVVAEAIQDESDGVAGAGLAAMGGFAFAPDGGASPEWEGYEPASLVVPEVSLARAGAHSRITINVAVAPDDAEDDLLARLQQRLRSLHAAALPLFDPAPIGEHRVVSSMPPAHFEEAVARAVQRIDAGDFEKLVLARQVDVYAPRPHDPAAVFGLLREAFPSSFVYSVGRGDAVFIGATPELLIRRQGQRASTVALAGSTRRSADPAVDDHLAEQLLRSDKNRSENAIVARRIVHALEHQSVWVTTAEEPVVIKVANIQHLAAPIRAQLAAPVDALTLAGLLHPTPAVGAEPPEAVARIPGLEGFDRGWYAGAVGWVDATGDGEFCVALRCALVRGRRARCYAGCGIVRDSDPAAELAESEIKLEVMLPALAG
jgi:isochorismate synthase